MFAIGCMLPVILFVLGAIGGAMLGGNSGSIWGAVIGLVAGTVIPVAMLIVARSGRRK